MRRIIRVRTTDALVKFRLRRISFDDQGVNRVRWRCQAQGRDYGGETARLAFRKTLRWVFRE